MPIVGATQTSVDGFAALEPAAEGLGHGLDGDIVVSGPDAAGREDVIVGVAHRLHFARDLIDVVGDRENPLDIDAEDPQLLTEIGGVCVDNFT